MCVTTREKNVKLKALLPAYFLPCMCRNINTIESQYTSRGVNQHVIIGNEIVKLLRNTPSTLVILQLSFSGLTKHLRFQKTQLDVLELPRAQKHSEYVIYIYVRVC